MTDLSQRGNSILLVGLAVGLLGVIFFVAFGGEEGIAQKERHLIAASQIVQYPAAIDRVIDNMLENGAILSDLDFSEEVDAENINAVFGPAGGGLEYFEITPYLEKNTYWKFKTLADETQGYFVMDIGRNDSGIGRDVIAYLDGIPLNVCTVLRKGLGQEAEPTVEETRLDFSLNEGAGGADAAGDNEFTFTSMPGAPYSCVKNGKNKGASYTYYHVVHAQ